ncbi:DUF6461 domain-containing protein [Streptomyces sp. NPDC054933]
MMHFLQLFCEMREGMSSGVRWLAESEWLYSITFARGLSPEELAARVGAAPANMIQPLTEREAVGLLVSPDICIARIGQEDDWSFAAEYGEARGSRQDVLKEVSRDGVDAVNLDPQVDHPPPMFSYASDGEVLCSFGLGEEWSRWGAQPDLLNPAMEAAGVIMPGGVYLEVSGKRYAQRVAISLGVVEKHFGLSLPHDFLEDRSLSAVVISGSPDLSTL